MTCATYHTTIIRQQRKVIWSLIAILIAALFAILIGCGEGPPHIEDADTPAILSVSQYQHIAAQWFQKNYGANAQTLEAIPIEVKTQADLFSICKIDPAAEPTLNGCNTQQNIYIEKPTCGLIAHEIAHSASYQLYNDVDPDHQQFGGNYYYEVVKDICRESMTEATLNVISEIL